MFSRAPLSVETLPLPAFRSFCHRADAVRLIVARVSGVIALAFRNARAMSRPVGGGGQLTETRDASNDEYLGRRPAIGRSSPPADGNGMLDPVLPHEEELAPAGFAEGLERVVGLGQREIANLLDRQIRRPI